MSRGQLRSLLFYCAAAVLLSIYGIEVCPYIEGLHPGIVAATLAGYFAAGFILRGRLIRSKVLPEVLIKQPARIFWAELGIFALCGLLITVHNTMFYDFPFGSGLKLALGCLCWGFFAGLDAALEWERKLLLDAESLPRGEFPREHYRSLARSFSGVMVAGIFLVCGIVVLVLVRDLHWISRIDAEQLPSAAVTIVAEIGFITVTLLVLTLNLIRSASRNLRLFFENESRALEKVAVGDYRHYVPISSPNEFGVIAGLTNSMIDQLREQNLIKQAFGKIVSPQVAKRLLAQAEGGIRLGGSRLEVTILVSDIYNFTTRSEQVEPEAIVTVLNQYFTEMVAIVHSHGGIVDKFLGDGMLAVFGLDTEDSGESQAVQAAIAMHSAVQKLNQSISPPITIGIGLHSGAVVVGNIGSYERLEFTVIGDVVNVASRLEGLTRSLKQQLVISKEVFENLNPELRQLPWTNCGEQMLKGKEKRLSVYGLSNET